MKKFSVLIMSVVITSLLASGCSFGLLSKKPETFSKSGMTITLDNSFYEKEMVSYTACYDSAKVAVFALKEEFSLAEGVEDYTLNEYANVVISNNGLDVSTEKKEDLICFKFDKTANGKDFSYLAFVFKGSDAFWLFQFCCKRESYESHYNDFITWAKTIVVE